MKIIVVDRDKCTGCGACQAMCAVAKKGKAQPSEARIRVQRRFDVPFHSVTVCRHCEEPACRSACLMDTIEKSQATGTVGKDQDQCFGCNACTVLCPFGAPVVDSDIESAVVCDFCDGDPVCVRVCPQSALLYGTPEQISANQRTKHARRHYRKLEEAI